MQETRTTEYEINGVLFIIEAFESVNAKESACNKVRHLIMNNIKEEKTCA
ncbi:MAG: hypothetical protein HUK24_06840 [Sphaerochaetaceae bacterium]|nr:hypothetical protein [Sphaerochaetaceae bacterium]